MISLSTSISSEAVWIKERDDNKVKKIKEGKTELLSICLARTKIHKMNKKS